MSQGLVVSPILEIRIVKVKPKYFLHYVQMLPKGMELVGKYGGKLLGTYFTEAGPGPEVVFIVQWDSVSASFDARSQAAESNMKDPEFIKFFTTVRSFIYCADDYVGVECPVFPMQNIDGSGKIFLKMLSVKTFPVYAAHKLAECIKSLELNDPLAVILPLTFSQAGLIALLPVPDNKVDPIMEKMAQCMSNPQNWPKMAEVGVHVGEMQSRLLMPLKDAEAFPKPE